MSLSSYVLQRFVTPKEGKDKLASFSSSKGTTAKCEQGTMSGEEAKTFYETILSSNSSDVQGIAASNTQGQDKTRKRNKSNNSRPSAVDSDWDGVEKKKSSKEKSRKLRETSSIHRLVNEFLKHAQEGNLRQVQELLSDNIIDINSRDQFSWTPLMCASHGGQIHIVKYLLDKGALWKSHQDLQGRTALDLAKLAGHFDIVELLASFKGRAQSKHKLPQEARSSEKTKFWCSICEQEFTDDRKRHEGSTVHLFNIQRKPQRTFYYIAEGNVGYQMMLKSGWNEDKGLGPDGVGRKYPVKTVLKRDRLGLGSKGRQQARVTHFGPNDLSAVKRKKVIAKEGKKREPRKKISRQERQAKEKKEKNWERNMRIYMNS